MSTLQTFSASFTKAGCLLVREKPGKFEFSSRSGKSQGILKNGQGNPQMLKSQGILYFLDKKMIF